MTAWSASNPVFPAAASACCCRRRASTSGSPSELVLPTWTGNEYRYDDGSRPVIRTLTPLRCSPDDGELDVEVVLHGAGPLSEWAATAGVGAAAAVSGPGRGYEVDADARSFVLAGDESALPALGLLVGAMPPAAEVRVIVEIADVSARLGRSLPDRASPSRGTSRPPAPCPATRWRTR